MFDDVSAAKDDMKIYRHEYGEYGADNVHLLTFFTMAILQFSKYQVTLIYEKEL
jgi:hypothetical protein